MPKQAHATEGWNPIDLRNLLQANCGVIGIRTKKELEDDFDDFHWASHILRFVELILSVLKKRSPDFSCKFYIEERMNWSVEKTPRSFNEEDSTKEEKEIATQSLRTLLQEKLSELERIGKEIETLARKVATGTRVRLEQKTFGRLLSLKFGVPVQLSFVPKIKNYDRVPDFIKLRIPLEAVRRVPYADLIAFLWVTESGRSKAVHKSLSKSGENRILFDVEETQRLFRLAALGDEPLSESDWQDFSMEAPWNYRRFLMDFVGARCKTNPKEWELYLEYTLRHLNSKAIRMRALAVQVEWLEKYKPEAVGELPAEIRFALLIVKIAEGNHKGASLDKAYESEFEELGKILKRENVRLVAEATLHLAVSDTNIFRFKKARERLLEVNKISPLALGLQLKGRVLSSLGQCEAFLGNNKNAIELFDQAIACFKKLSNKKEASGDIDQTGAYKVIAMMDSCSGDKKSKACLSQEMETYLKSDLPTACRELATRTDSQLKNAQKYHHHILLRYLASGHAESELIAVYKACRTNWNQSDGYHPWELIEFYRWVLFGEKLSTKRCLQICKANDVTLKVIGLALLGAIDSVAQKKELTPPICAALSRLLSKSAYDALLSQAEKKLSPMEFVKKVLPFNFR